MIKKLFEKIKRDELLRGSIILFIMINIYNVFNYLFHFSMARILGPADYGVLAVLFSLVYIFSIPSEAIQNIITSYSSKLNSKKQDGKIKFLVLTSLKKGFGFSFILFFLFIPVSFILSAFLKIDYKLFILTGLIIFSAILLPISRGVLQGKKKFSSLGTNMISEGFLKFSLAILFVFIGWKVYGSIIAVVIGLVIPIFLAFYSIKDVLKTKSEKENFSGIYSYSLPYFICMISIVLIYSLDVIFAKRFFSPDLAGKYSVASTFGKIIFFGILAISKAMFPITCETHVSGNKTGNLLKKSLIISLIASGIILLIYAFLPELIIGLLFGSQYLEISSILFIIGLALTFLSFANLIILYGLSTNKVGLSSISLIIFVVLEITLFSLFHNTLLQFAICFLTTNFLMLVFSIILIKYASFNSNSCLQ